MLEAPSADQACSDPWTVEKLLLSLPPTQRAIVLLRYQEEMGPLEIAAALALPIATVKSHLQRALKLLRSKAERMGKADSRHA